MTKSEILADIRQKILSEHYPQGHSLVERDLCDIYNVSRTPIREVLWSLVVDGIVEKQPSKGFLVRKLDWSTILEIFEAREPIEGMAARIAALRLKEPHTHTLRELRDELLELDIETHSQEGARIGRRMHKVIIDAAANHLLSDIYTKLSYLSAMTTNMAKRNVTIERESKKYHIAIMESIIAGDAENSEIYMREHLRITCRNLIGALYPQILTSFGNEHGRPDAARNREIGVVYGVRSKTGLIIHE